MLLFFFQSCTQTLNSHRKKLKNVSNSPANIIPLPIISYDIYSYNSNKVHLVVTIWIICLIHRIWIIFGSYNLLHMSECDPWKSVVPCGLVEHDLFLTPSMLHSSAHTTTQTAAQHNYNLNYNVQITQDLGKESDMLHTVTTMTHILHSDATTQNY